MDDQLRAHVDHALSAGKPEDAACYLAEIVDHNPNDRLSRLALAIALGDGGYPAGALRIMRALADRLAHKGFLLAAMVVVRQGLEHAKDDPSLLATLRRLHVRGVRAKAGNLPIPPPLRPRKQTGEATTAQALLALSGQERLEKATTVGTTFPTAGTAAMPLPMPLFSELEESSFVETVKRLRYQRVAQGTKILEEGKPGDTLLVVASGAVDIDKGGTHLAKIGPGAVLGEMALITGAPRSATATALEEVEFFELSRAEVATLARAQPQIAEELVEYCRRRLIGNLLRTSPLFKGFNDETRNSLIGRFQRQGFGANDTIIQQGQPGTGLYVIATGEVEVTVTKDDGEKVVVANLNPGEVFGEISLLKHQPTTATVRARNGVGVLFLPRDEFQEVLDETPSVREYLQSLSEDRLKASEAARDADEVLDADDLIVL
ncbi:cyclic nucleotide-binding domain-containing protein [Myxococcota bacterium]